MNKPIVVRRPWWRHPIFPWGWYSLTQDNLAKLLEIYGQLMVDGYHYPHDGGGGLYILDTSNVGEDENSGYIKW